MEESISITIPKGIKLTREQMIEVLTKLESAGIEADISIKLTKEVDTNV